MVNHITDALPTPGEGLWEPLSVDYIKALRVLLQYPPHVEHLSRDDWHILIDFCLRGIGVGEESSESQLTIRSGRLSSESFNDRGSRAGSTVPRLSQRGQGSHVDLKSNAEELELCIQLLTSSSASPVLDGAEKLLCGLSDYLSSLNTLGRSPYAAFGALNAVLAKAITDNTMLVQETVFSILPTIRRFWISKSAPLKDELLVTLMLGKDILTKQRVISSELPIDTLQSLVEQIHRSYTRLSEKEVLQLDDLMFTFDSTSTPMATGFIAPRLAISKSVQNWVVLSTIGMLSKLVDDLRVTPNPPEVDAESNKRQQLLSRVDDIFREASSSFGGSRICALQLIPFIAHHLGTAERISSSLQLLTVNILDENPAISSWTMIAIARLAHHLQRNASFANKVLNSIAGCKCASAGELKTSWIHVWELASRALPSPIASRAACTLMCAILHSQLLGYVDVVNTIESVVSSVDLNGPGSLTDSSLCLWRMFMELKSKANPAQTQEMAKQICGWLKTTWTFGTAENSNASDDLLTWL